MIDLPLATPGVGGGQLHDGLVGLLAATLGTAGHRTERVSAYPLDASRQCDVARRARLVAQWVCPQLVHGVWTPDVPSADENARGVHQCYRDGPDIQSL